MSCLKYFLLVVVSVGSVCSFAGGARRYTVIVNRDQSPVWFAEPVGRTTYLEPDPTQNPRLVRETVYRRLTQLAVGGVIAKGVFRLGDRPVEIVQEQGGFGLVYALVLKSNHREVNEIERKLLIGQATPWSGEPASTDFIPIRPQAQVRTRASIQQSDTHRCRVSMGGGLVVRHYCVRVVRKVRIEVENAILV
jgi:hypothetical protein